MSGKSLGARDVNRHRWLESAEWLSLLGLVIGSVAAGEHLTFANIGKIEGR